MPGVKRRLRLVVDWTVDLLFDRDASELGQLGHPPALDDADRPGEAARAQRGRHARRTAARAARSTAGARAYP